MKTALLIILFLAALLWFMSRLFRFTDHDDNMDDEGGWK
ncbi:MAG: hypothetical protein RL317_91 [Pseudomonadota bacterium]|jgi:hypothetical protein